MRNRGFADLRIDDGDPEKAGWRATGPGADSRTATLALTSRAVAPWERRASGARAAIMTAHGRGRSGGAP